ncbi:RNA polymerase subunit sigma [Bosea sp. Root670]|uniref:RNA polymerase sigma factor n=1 Tax=Bosea sp. Root670 TaxID=1736583 RepID=UPI0007149B9A|nr:RNA polymerase sigma factor [Bosea sp. Root670]KRE01292.1 RNA polymerase subunit sigma [Bosea sp. Root670]
MPSIPTVARDAGSASADDLDLARRASTGDPQAFRTIMTTHNQALYRIARAVIRNDSEAEDVVQEAYVRAFSHLDSFRGEATLSTWLSRITLNEALGRLRRKKRADKALRAEDPGVPAQIIPFPGSSSGDDPERMMAQRQILQLVERATDNLPDVYRGVFMARVIEGRSVEETAELLDIRAETVKTRLYRARLLVRKELEQQIGPVLLDAFPFAGRRCERLTAAVMQRLGIPT